MWLGRRSYSLYAIHFPVLLLIWAVESRWGMSHGPAVVAILAVGVPASVATAQVLHLLVEGPSLVKVREQRLRRPAEATDGGPVNVAMQYIGERSKDAQKTPMAGPPPSGAD
jgi:peptidoglycan/LPS O-acetylase OafA/YrhL